MKRVALLLPLAFLACRDEPKPVPAVEAPASSNGLRPLSSRDGAASSLPPHSGDTLPPGHPPVGSGAATGAGVSGTIAVGPSVASRVAAGEVLFIVARSATNRQVLAVRKEENPQFPFAFRISAADAMVEGTAFAGPVDVTARISKSGDAIPGKGDIEGFARGVATGATDVAITLDSVRQ